MKATVYYDVNGVIQSVVYVNPKSRIRAVCAEHASLEIDLKGTKSNALTDIHSKYRVDTVHRKLIQRSTSAKEE